MPISPNQLTNFQMMYLIIYDISDNRKRRKVAKLLTGQGYERIQLSVFAGPFSPTSNKELWQHLQKIKKANSDSEASLFYLMVVEVPVKQFLRIQSIGDSGFNMEEMTGTASTLWL